MSENATRKAFTLCAPHCGNNPCSFEVELSGKEIRSFKSHPKMRFKPCIKGFQIPGRYAHPDRLLHPMRRVGPKGSGPDGGNSFERISWDEALDLVAQGLEAAKEKGGNESVIMYNYAGQHTLPGGKDAGPATILRLLNLWGGAVPAYERGSLCWKAFQMGTKDVFGHWQFRLRDTEKCDWIIIWGNNPVETAYRGHLQALQAAKRRGTRFIVVDPVRTKTAERFADRHVAIRPSTDTALALAVLRLLFTEGNADEAAFRDRTNAPFLVRESDGTFLTAKDGRPLVWDEAKGAAVPFDTASKPALSGRHEADGVPCRPAMEMLREAAAPWTPGRAARECGVSEEDVRAIASALRSGRINVYHGAYQRTLRGEQAVRALHILNLAAGAFEGILHHGARSEAFQPERSTEIGLVRVMTDRWAVPNPVATRVPVGQFGEAVLNPDAYETEFHAALIMWGNPVGQGGDSHKSERALHSLDFVAVADIFMTQTARCADVVLPVSTWLERCAITEGLETGEAFSHLIPELAPRRQIHYSPGALPPRGESLDDFEVICRLARKMCFGNHFPWKSSREWIEELISTARQDERFPWFGEVTMERLEAEGIISLDVPSEILSREADTPSGRIQIYNDALEDPLPRHVLPEDVPDGDKGAYPLQLISPKTYFRASSTFNTSANLLRHGFNVATLHPDDATARDIKTGDRVALFNGRGRTEFEAKVSDIVRPGVVHIPAGGTPELGCANLLTGDGLSEHENATYNSYTVEVERARNSGEKSARLTGA